MRTSKRIMSIAAASALSVVLTACTTLDPYSREEKTSNATKGALIGAAVGAVAGLISGDDAVDRRQRALIGAGVGALAGGSVGVYMDRQEAELRAQLESSGVSVTRVGDNITLNMPGNITFATNSSDLNPAFFNVLGSVTTVLTKYEKTVVEVAGHTDSDGSAEYNQALSVRRANTVSTYLSGQGVISQRIIALGEGERRPIAGNDTAAGKQANRRVELTLVPLTG
ncbi:MAG: OmpA family protein [Pseudomonadota bacterium]